MAWADENYTLFRADAVFKLASSEYEVPVFASKNQKGEWKWFVRFRPHLPGGWDFKVRVLCWHPSPSTDEPKEAKHTERKDGKETTYYVHEFGYNPQDYIKYPKARRGFTVTPAGLLGPLETPKKDGKDNINYFYRWTSIGSEYKRRPFFLLGAARPWNTQGDKDDNRKEWDNYLDRDKQLFEPMRNAGCNVLYHWMAPWESQLIHQSQDEYWPKPNGKFEGAYPGKKLGGSDAQLGYKRYDQGRALHTDRIFDLAQKHEILIFLSVMSHQSLNQHPHLWHGEHGWVDDPRELRLNPPVQPLAPPALNGFQLFESTSGHKISIDNFFEMAPRDSSSNSWKRRLWKHFANYWRYIIGRWTAHSALGAWVLIDELEGVGLGDNWWWQNKEKTYPWHDNLISLMRGKLVWKEWNGTKLYFTGDYLQHPITTSTTYYGAKGAGEPKSELEVLERINNFGELEDHGRWQGNLEKTDFVSHHAYQFVPTWGKWSGSASSRSYEKDSRFTGWKLTNSEGTEYINTDRWLWDSLCMRLRNWGRANKSVTRLVTEYGCYERELSTDSWDYFGPRVPSFTHFANWAALVLGHAGIPFKWNDGKNFGEMIYRTGEVWDKKKYPVDNYKEITNIVKFLKGVALDELYPDDVDEKKPSFEIVDENDKQDKDFNVWALDRSRKVAIAWLYERTFGGKYSKSSAPKRWLKIKVVPNQAYRYNWFDTWEGVFLAEGSHTEKADIKGILKIPLPTIKRALEGMTVKKVSNPSGNDIAIRLTLGK